MEKIDVESPLQSQHQCHLVSEDSVKVMAQAIAENFMEREARMLGALKEFSLEHKLTLKKIGNFASPWSVLPCDAASVF